MVSVTTFGNIMIAFPSNESWICSFSLPLFAELWLQVYYDGYCLRVEIEIFWDDNATQTNLIQV